MLLEDLGEHHAARYHPCANQRYRPSGSKGQLVQDELISEIPPAPGACENSGVPR